MKLPFEILSLTLSQVVQRLLYISRVVRKEDWQYSLLPFLLGLTYLWVWWFELHSNPSTFLMLIFFAISAVGFAALGYLINETFDVEQDTIAGKKNRMVPLSYPVRAIIFLLAAFMAFVPWCWLPSNNLTWWVLISELVCFLVYSAPFPRLKDVPIVAEILDMAYAYLIPAILSLHTFSGIGSPYSYQIWQWLLLVGVALTGLRNILIHRLNDRENDQRSGLLTLPILLGTGWASVLVAALVVIESFCYFSALLLLWTERSSALAILTAYVLFILLRFFFKRISSNAAAVSTERWMHLLDPFHQMIFPLLMLLLLAIDQPYWIIGFLIHAGLFLPDHVFQKMVILFRRHVPTTVNKMRVIIGRIVNLLIYLLFNAFGVNLRKENTDALGYLRAKFKG